MLAQTRFGMMLLLSLTVVAGSYGTTVEHNNQDNSQKITPISGHNRDEREDGDMGHMPHSANEQPTDQSTHATEDVPCQEEQSANNHAMDDFLTALKDGWNRESEQPTEFQRFGMCSQHDAIPDFQVSALTRLAESAHQQSNGLKVVHATKVDIWDAEKDGEITLALTFPRQAQPTNLASLMLLFSVDSIKGDGLRMTFSSHTIHPYKQTICISKGMLFIFLTGGQREHNNHSHLKLRLAVETLKTENSQKPSLSELQEVLMRKVDGNNITMRPKLLFLSDRGNSDEHRTPYLKFHGIPLDQRPSPGPLPPSRTFLFLCELKKLFNDIQPEKELPTPQEEASTVSLDTLHSLPPLTLGVSSTESLLSVLVNSSTPTAFVFPQRQQSLQNHRVELTLESPLLSVLRQRLDEAIAQVKKEAGQKVIDRLQKLSELSALPPDGDDDKAISQDYKEAQYRAVLLLKALQTVLRTLEVERAQRTARADEDGPTTPSQCRLQSLTVSLRKYYFEPSMANINNCVGACVFPVDNGINHAILLNHHIESGQLVTRSPCCVPVDYIDLHVIELESVGTQIAQKRNVVATTCGCR
ncbi:muellerian-inhibiting factor-like isoform X2 [Myxocyprinus asiaticus]|uniref:muellerian-inhibiting factor-like isoform X2 n=1 Tax=Myxocyprinus asiaticus TaxID=70543 RepID=UPI002221FDD2|nr:muellerian-inhibiting factor-like isoform X2 [Myxocyprinus asiaticus]